MLKPATLAGRNRVHQRPRSAGRTYIKKDAALDAASDGDGRTLEQGETIDILEELGIITAPPSDHHDAVEAAVWSPIYITGRCLPDKIDVIDESGAGHLKSSIFWT